MKYLPVFVFLFLSCNRTMNHSQMDAPAIDVDVLYEAFCNRDSLQIELLEPNLLMSSEKSEINRVLLDCIETYRCFMIFDFEGINQINWEVMSVLNRNGYKEMGLFIAYNKFRAQMFSEPDSDFLNKIDSCIVLFSEFQSNCSFWSLISMKASYLQMKGYHNLALRELQNLEKQSDKFSFCANIRSSTQVELAFIYSALKMPEKSLACASLALEYSSLSSDKALSNALIARSYMELKTPEKGLVYLYRSLELEDTNNVEMMNYYKSLLIESYAILNNFAMVDSMFNSFSQSDEYRGYHKFLFFKAKALSLKNRKNFKASHENYFNALNLLDKNYLFHERIIFKDISDVHRLLGNIDSAFYYLNEYQTQEEAFTKKLNETKVAEQALMVDLSKNQADLLIEKGKSTEQKQRINSQKTTLYFVFWILFVLTVVSFILVFINRRIKKRSQRIFEEHQMIEAINKEYQNRQQIVELELQQAKQQLEAAMSSKNKISNSEKSPNLILQNQEINQDFQELDISIFLNFRFIDDQDWSNFKELFGTVYPEYLNNLLLLYPDLTLSDQKIACLHRLNMSRTDIAEIMGVSADSLRKTNQRMRSRLGIQDQSQMIAHLFKIPTHSEDVTL